MKCQQLVELQNLYSITFSRNNGRMSIEFRNEEGEVGESFVIDEDLEITPMIR